MPTLITCKHCGKSFPGYLSNRTKYCSRACANIGKKKKVYPTCEQCGATFEIYPSLVRKGKGRFCSPACVSTSRRKPHHEDRICAQCNNTFAASVYNLRMGWGRFCSRTCSDIAKFKQTFRPCDTCGKSFGVTPSEIQQGRRFCSTACAYKVRSGPTSPTWKGGITPAVRKARNSTEYKEWRKGIMEAQNYTCQKCGQHGGALQVHHLYRFSRFPHLRYSLSNGHTLCHSCHLAVKGHEDEYLISVGLSPLTPPLF